MMRSFVLFIMVLLSVSHQTMAEQYVGLCYVIMEDNYQPDEPWFPISQPFFRVPLKPYSSEQMCRENETPWCVAMGPAWYLDLLDEEIYMFSNNWKQNYKNDGDNRYQIWTYLQCVPFDDMHRPQKTPVDIRDSWQRSPYQDPLLNFQPRLNPVLGYIRSTGQVLRVLPQVRAAIQTAWLLVRIPGAVLSIAVPAALPAGNGLPSYNFGTSIEPFDLESLIDDSQVYDLIIKNANVVIIKDVDPETLNEFDQKYPSAKYVGPAPLEDSIE
ncbi:MAG: hypothetical protein KDD48_06500 [Bdellovibrionales bacterium]|nr:hypothetical protein [Bdellovibrionales bacterium]